MPTKFFGPVFRIALTTTALLAGGLSLRADARDDDIAALRDQIRLLDRKLRVLERRQELKDEDSATAVKAAPKITLNDRGFTFASSDGANAVKIRGLVQFDSRFYFDDHGAGTNTFVLRRARLISEGALAKIYGFQLVPEFGGSAFSLLDANITLTASKALQFKAGKFKVPVGLELLQSDSWTFFDERSLVTNLVPNRDLGVQVGGDVVNGTVNYAVGIFGGVGDGGSSTNTDFDNEKDFVARVFASPFKGAADSPLAGLSFGLAGSLGREKTASALTGGYRTDGQQTFFKYKFTTVSDGRLWRVSPQLDYRAGPFGLQSEYVVSTANVRPSATGAKVELQNKAWQVSAGYVLTGEDSSYSGVVPKTNFDPSAGTWGAFEIAARYANLKIDSAAFPTFADPAANANEATTFSVGLNWYLSKAVRATFDYFQTRFDTLVPPTAALLKQDEKALVTRFQVSF